MKPKQDDYQIIIQNAKDNISYAEIIFYNDQTYHEPVRRTKTNGENQIETTVGDLNKLSFDFGEYYSSYKYKHKLYYYPQILFYLVKRFRILL